MNLRKVKQSSIVILISLIFMILAYLSILSTLNGLDKFSYFAFAGIPGWILLLVGSGMVIKQHKYYVYAFIAFLIMTAVSIAMVVLPIAISNLDATVLNVIITGSQVASLVGLLMIIEAIKEAFKDKGDYNGYSKINSIGLIYTILVIVQAILTWFKIQDTTFQNVITIIRFVLNIVADFVFAFLLIKSIKEIDK